MHHRKPRTRALRNERAEQKHHRAHRRRTHTLLHQALTHTWKFITTLTTAYTAWDITTRWWPW